MDEHGPYSLIRWAEDVLEGLMWGWSLGAGVQDG